LRILLANWSPRLAGGAELYVASVVPELHQRGHGLAFLYENDVPVDRDPIPLPDSCPTWDVSRLGLRMALAKISEWRPDVVFVHGLQDPETEGALLDVVSSVLLAHTYYGTCISGSKTFKFPHVRPCDRRFGPACLLLYYPRRTGGLNPLTMLRMYRLQSSRLRHLRRYDTVLTLSNHMRSECVFNGVPESCAHRLPLPAPLGYRRSVTQQRSARSFDAEGDRIHLLFVGRMDLLKGGRVALDAVHQVRRKLGYAVRFTMVGDGPDRAALERKARAMTRNNPEIKIEFTGWCDRDTIRSLMDAAHVLVVPSLWPEPLGLVGLEAQFHGLPVAAFDAGGITEWLHDGVNGHLARLDPPNAGGLADTIAACLASQEHYSQLSGGALDFARRIDHGAHIMRLEEILGTVSAERRNVGTAED
jgi:glycosyltransferase involved in cell wall biosynthesis